MSAPVVTAPGAAGRPPTTKPPPSPYRGLRFFTEADEDAAFFFGRTEEVEINAANLLSARLTLLYGPSGVGKSSILLAGVVNSLRKRSRSNLAEEDAAGFAVVVMRAWSDPEPLKTIAAAVRAEAEALLERDDLPDPPDRATLAEVLDHWSVQVRGKLLVIFDQFEEYFLYHDRESGPGTLDAEFPQAVNQAKLRANFLLSIRDDALARLDRFKGRIPTLFDNRLQIEDLTLTAARETVKRPIAEYNKRVLSEQQFEIQEELVEAVLTECAAEGLTLTAGSESPDVQASVTRAPSGRTRIKAPFLQLVLDRLWRNAAAAGAHTLTVAQLDDLGRVKGIVENHLRGALDSLSPPEQAIAAKCFRLLVSPTKTKIAYPATALTDLAGRPEREVTAVLDKLCAADTGRILHDFAPAQGEGGKSYELFHDLLAEPIIAWRNEYEAAQHREAEEQRRRAVRRRYQRIGAVLVALVAVFAALGAWSLVQRNDARRATASAASVALATAADQQLASHRDIALLLSLEAYHAKGTPQAESSVLAALRSVQRAGVHILRGNQGGVTDVASSKDGKTLAVAGSDGTVQLWNASQHTRLGEPLNGHHGAVTAVALGLGQTLAAAYDDGTVLLWDMGAVSTGAVPEPKALTPRGKGAVTTLAFSGDGKTLAAADSNGTVRIWKWGKSAKTWGRLGHDLAYAGITGMALANDGSGLAASDAHDSRIKFWYLTGGNWEAGPAQAVPRSGGQAITAMAYSPRDEVAVAFAPDNRTASSTASVVAWGGGSTPGTPVRYDKYGIRDLGFSPDGKMLASAGGDGRVHLLDVHGVELKPHGEPLNGQQGPVSSVAFDGHETVVAGYDDGTVLLWPLGAKITRGGYTKLSDTFLGSFAVAFSADGKKFATADFADGSVRLWDANGNMLGAPLSSGARYISWVAFRPDGTLVAIGENGTGGTVQFWDTRNRQRLGPPQHVGSVSSAALSPDGRTLAIAGSATVQLWSTRRHQPVGQPLNGKQGPVRVVAFSPDGSTLATANVNGTVVLWDVKGRTQLGKPLYVGENGVDGIAFSPDTTTLATAGTNGTVLLWDISNIRDTRHLQNLTPQLLPGSQGSVWGVAFSPDGHTVASAGDDGTVVLYNRDTHARQVLDGHQGAVYGVAFSQDWELAAAGINGTVLWAKKDVAAPWRNLSDLKKTVCGLVAGNLTKTEWKSLAPRGQAYRTTCPG